MAQDPYIATVASLIGDPARANMLLMLMDGRAFTAKELAYAAGISAQTASGHLNKLTTGKLICAVKQGRHKYFRLASLEVAQIIESLAVMSLDGPPRHRPISGISENLRRARTCYDHIAGKLGVALFDAMAGRELLKLSDEHVEILPEGNEFLMDLGIDMVEIRRQRRTFCKACLDWSERRTHLAGAVGSAITDQFMALGWIERRREARVLRITALGETELYRRLRIDVSAFD